MKYLLRLYCGICDYTQRLYSSVQNALGNFYIKAYMEGKGCLYGKDFRIWGGHKFKISPDAKVVIGKHFRSRGRGYGIDSGNDSIIFVGKGAKLTIGDNTGMANTSIHCYEEIVIGHHVNIGGGSKIFDTNFHSTDWRDRQDRKKDIENKKSAPVHIGDYVFIGARCIICKGVTLGDRSMVAAGSVVVKDIPADEVWGGNPAKFIKRIDCNL